MQPEEMTDEQLVGPRSITQCVEASDGGWECVLSCGHEIVMVGAAGGYGATGLRAMREFSDRQKEGQCRD